MSKKHKCKLCAQSMQWAFPGRITSDNYEYAKHCLNAIKNSLVCGQTAKVKRSEHEQYCKYFIPKDECDLEYDNRRIERLEKLIKDFECRQIDAEDE